MKRNHIIKLKDEAQARLDRKVKGGGAILLNENGKKSDILIEEGQSKIRTRVRFPTSLLPMPMKI